MLLLYGAQPYKRSQFVILSIQLVKTGSKDCRNPSPSRDWNVCSLSVADVKTVLSRPVFLDVTLSRRELEKKTVEEASMRCLQSCSLPVHILS